MKMADLSDAEFQRRIDTKRQARMDRVDGMPDELRRLVHEYGLTVVTALLDVGVTKPKRIRHVVETVLNEFSPTRGCFSSQGVEASGFELQVKPKRKAAS